ncbi:MAG: alpha/beta fold hydrolase [Microbacterium sp.]|uniref:alpha/beta fold hydrolase n=1 Tax=Microbacterium sp. TaxID=51671 RepID=UPI0039E332F2
MTHTQIFEPDSRAIPYAVEGVRRTVVLIADAGLGIDSLGALAASLAVEEYRVVRVGARERADAAGSSHVQAQDVVDILDHLGIADAWIGGHGAGGTVARAVAADHPSRVDGVVLLGVEAGGDAPADGIPVLVIQGTQDEVTPPANGDALQASAPGLVSLVRVDGGGHLFPATHVGQTSWAIEDYLDWD